MARQALAFSADAQHARAGLVDGEPAIPVEPHGRLALVLTFEIADDRIAKLTITGVAR